MKRVVAGLVAMALITSYSVPVFAETNVGEHVTEVETKTTPVKLKGDLEVDINFKMPIRNTTEESTDIKVTLNSSSDSIVLPLGGAGSEEVEKVEKVTFNGEEITYKVRKLNHEGSEVTKEDLNVYYYAIKFYNLPTDKYNLNLNGTGFKSVNIDNVDIENYSKRISISNDGVFLPGDIDENGIVNDEDYNLLLNNIDTTNSELIKKYDLNRDGKVDLTDLTYVHNSLNVNAKGAAVVNTNAIINPNTIKLEESKGVIKQGSIEDIFVDNGSAVIIENTDTISEESPVEIGMEFNDIVQMEQIRINPQNLGSAPTKGQVIVVDENGTEQTVNYNLEETAKNIARFSDDTVNGSIVINLGKQVAVKKVKIVVTGTSSNNNLTEIGKVEFLNNVYDKVPEPEMNIPKNLKVKAENEKLTLTWDKETNVTGYEAKCELIENGVVKETKIVQTSKNSAEFEKLNNFSNYTLSVQSLNEEWSSGYSDGVIGTPVPTEKPAPPEGINAEGKYREVALSWSKNKKAEGYNLYYKKTGDSEFKEVKGITSTSYSIKNLEDEAEYEMYLTAYNSIGVSEKSQTYKAKTTTITAPKTTNYKLLNTPNGEGITTNHIIDVEYSGGYNPNEYPEGFNKFNVVDNDYATHWTDAGGNRFNGPIVTFDEAYEMDRMVYVARRDGDYGTMYVNHAVKVWEESEDGTLVEREFSKNEITVSALEKGVYSVKFPKVNAKKIQVKHHRAYAATMSASELKFYHYDSIEDDVRALFTDDLLLELNKDVTLEHIEELENRINTKDEYSDEYHPNRDNILFELSLAKNILQDKEISNDIITVDQNINNGRNGHLGFAMQLNDYQPLGISARAGEEIAVYVGTQGNVIPELVFTQYYPESGKWNTTVKNLKKGKNLITVPKIGTMSTERGGSVYVRYPSTSKSNNEIKIRVSGGTKIPVLSVAGLENEAEIKNTVKKYISELKNYVNNIESLYDGEEYSYDPKTSVLNSTEIVTDNVLLTIPAEAALQGITEGISGEENEVNRLYNSLLAWEQLMDISYGKKGLYENPDINNDGKVDANEAKHAMPSSRINIRYTRMFDGAFMYASSGHIGVEYGSTVPLMKGVPHTKNVDGTLSEGSLFGWGIAHEIGHVIDEGHRIYGETSNNILSLLAQTFDDKSLSRLETSNKYEAIYDKVTSRTIGVPSDVFVALGMFWQLHLAYDNETNQSLLENGQSFYAKLNRLYRENTMEADKDNLLIRLASDAAGKDLSDFFIKWGLRPTEETLKYVSKYEKETKQIQYLNDEARRKKLQGITPMSGSTKAIASFVDYTDGQYVKDSKEVKLSLSVSEDSDKILGYEIYRNGVPVAFTTESEYTDIISAANNRAFSYEVVAYDYLLNSTEKVKIGEIKISHDGAIDKGDWIVSTNTSNDEDKNTEMNPSGPVDNPSINKVKDDNISTSYEGTKKGNEDPNIIIEMNDKQSIVGFKYTALVEEKLIDRIAENSIKDYEIYVSNDKENWTLAKTGRFNVDKNNPTELVYFNKEGVDGGKQLFAYDTSYVKLVAKGAKAISAAEVDIIAPPGDNVEISDNGIGILKEDFRFGNGEDEYIPKDSIVVTGEYRGDPAFNVVLLRDENNNVIGGEQIILAEVPEDGHLGQISSGTWIYWISKEEKDLLTSNIKAELYRVDNAETLEGQRLVSDTLRVKIPENLPEIELEGGIVPNEITYRRRED
ncbi:M60 family metallopeptidase [Clostridium ihumii]|uniref:M60 family metallopeptidase n=1 Tax=Clostridium ihumii TaxID=1470356 RepID=UPI0006856797|nr:M60 family metallopeptidase [Clostridium ihumii]